MSKQRPIHGAGPPGKPLLPLAAEMEILEKLGTELRIGADEIAAILKKHGVEADAERLQDSYRKRLGQRLMASIRDEEGRPVDIPGGGTGYQLAGRTESQIPQA